MDQWLILYEFLGTNNMANSIKMEWTFNVIINHIILPITSTWDDAGYAPTGYPSEPPISHVFRWEDIEQRRIGNGSLEHHPLQIVPYPNIHLLCLRWIWRVDDGGECSTVLPAFILYAFLDDKWPQRQPPDWQLSATKELCTYLHTSRRRPERPFPIVWLGYMDRLFAHFAPTIHFTLSPRWRARNIVFYYKIHLMGESLWPWHHIRTPLGPSGEEVKEREHSSGWISASFYIGNNETEGERGRRFSDRGPGGGVEGADGESIWWWVGWAAL